MWVLVILALLAAVACLIAFVRGGSSSYWDHPRLIDREAGGDDACSRKVA